MTTERNSDISAACDIGCIIMASGEGKRFGGNKLMADFGNKPLIAHIIDTAQHVFGSIVVVTRHEDVRQLCDKMNVAAVCHNLPYRSDTVRLGLEYLGRNFDGYIFCQGDQPLLSENTLSDMIREFKKDTKKIVRLQYDSTPCSPVIFPHWSYDELSTLPDGKGGNVIVKNHFDSVVYVSANNVCETIDVDTKEILQQLSEYL